MSVREYVKVYNKNLGRFQYQHYTGGIMFDSFNEMNPSLLKGGITGSGHTYHIKPKELNDKIVETGDEIIKNLKNLKIHKKRVSDLIKGSGMRVD